MNFLQKKEIALDLKASKRSGKKERNKKKKIGNLSCQ